MYSKSSQVSSDSNILNYSTQRNCQILSVRICYETSLQCGREQSTLGMMLRQLVFKKIKCVSPGLKCLQACNDDVRCQSFNYVISQEMCKLNNRTNEARPDDFIPDSDRYYFKSDVNRCTQKSQPTITSGRDHQKPHGTNKE